MIEAFEQNVGKKVNTHQIIQGKTGLGVSQKKTTRETKDQFNKHTDFEHFIFFLPSL